MTMLSFIPSFTTYKKFFASCAFVALFMHGLSVGSAMATSALTPSENEPASWELALPGATNTTDAPAQTEAEFEEVVVETDTNDTSTAANVVSDSATRRGNPADPCPDPRVAKSNRPDDLAKVQEDIDRFALCVQRAQLLERLNESATRAVEGTDKAMGFSAPEMPAGGAMPPLPAGSMGFDVEPRVDNAPARPAANNTPTAAVKPATSTETTQVAQVKTPAWAIREIFGSMTDMQARLLNAEGDEVLVKQGSRLNDGGIVTTITPSGVTLRSAEGVKSLEWSGN